MFFSWLKKVEDRPTASPVIKTEISEEDLFKEAYRAGRFSPTNSECPPAPDIIPVWIENNVQILEKYSDRLFEKYIIPPDLEPQIFLSMYKGFRDLVHSCPDGKNSPFCLGSEEVLTISKSIFTSLAKKRGVPLEFTTEL
jgi:hypothetical protein